MWLHACLAAAVLGLLAALVVPVAAAAEGDCPPAGGTPHPFETDETVLDRDVHDLVVNGGGFGHGIGMSQYGAQGAATLGCTHEQILSTYYPTTGLETRSSRDVVRIKMRTAALDPTRVRTTAEQFGGRPLDWVACDAYGEGCTTVATQPAGTTWTVVPHGQGGAWNLELRDADGASAWRGGDQGTRLRLMHDGTVVRVLEAVPSGSHDPAGMRVKWGWVEFDHTSANGGLTYVTSYVTGGASSGMSAIDTYLRGLAEVPASWEGEAQQAQAVAARSYAEAQMTVRDQVYDRVTPCQDCEPTDVPNRGTLCRCDLVPTTADQFWNGFDKEAGSGFPNWRDAIAATANQYVVSEGEVAATFYSSSHGDSSSASEDIWSADLPYLEAVDTSRWERASDNPFQRWTVGFTDEWLASRFGFDEFVSLEVVERGPGGRPSKDGVVVTGMKDGQEVQQTHGSESIRSKLRVRSGLIVPEEEGGASPSPSPAPSPSETAPTAPPTPQRIAGADRIATAVALSADAWDASDVVVLARADQPPDALAGSGLAGSLRAPLLVTWSDRLADEVAAELQRLGAVRVGLLGGAAALSPRVADQIRELGIEVHRIAGPTREGTAARIGELLAPDPGGTALIVRGRFPTAPQREWADALAASGLAARQGRSGTPWPILIADETVPSETRSAIDQLGITSAVVVGGSAVIPDEVVAELGEMGLDVRRVAGHDRYATSRAVASLDVGSGELLVVATGQDFPDGLAAGPYAAHVHGRLLLVPSEFTPRVTPWRHGEHPDWVRALDWHDPALTVAGGKRAVSSDVADRLAQALFEGAGGGD